MQLSDFELHEHAGERCTPSSRRDEIEPEPPPSSCWDRVVIVLLRQLERRRRAAVRLRLHEHAGERLYPSPRARRRSSPSRRRPVFATVSSSYRAASAAPAGLCATVRRGLRKRAERRHREQQRRPAAERRRRRPLRRPRLQRRALLDSIREHEAMMRSNCEGVFGQNQGIFRGHPCRSPHTVQRRAASARILDPRRPRTRMRCARAQSSRRSWLR